MASRSCDRCGAEFSARSYRARYCGDRCRNAANYQRRIGADSSLPLLTVAPPLPEGTDGNPETGALSRRAWADLRGYGEDATVPGLLTLTLARAIDSGGYSGSGLTALTREFSRVWREIVAGHRPVADTPLDVARRKRSARK